MVRGDASLFCISSWPSSATGSFLMRRWSSIQCMR